MTDVETKNWYIVHTQAKTLSPAAEAFRYFVLEEGERFVSTLFPEADVRVRPAPYAGDPA